MAKNVLSSLDNRTCQEKDEDSKDLILNSGHFLNSTIFATLYFIHFFMNFSTKQHFVVLHF